jgi:hypothetical protein
MSLRSGPGPSGPGGVEGRGPVARVEEHLLGEVALAQALVAQRQAVARRLGPRLVPRLLPQAQGPAVEVERRVVVAEHLRGPAVTASCRTYE